MRKIIVLALCGLDKFYVYYLICLYYLKCLWASIIFKFSFPFLIKWTFTFWFIMLDVKMKPSFLIAILSLNTPLTYLCHSDKFILFNMSNRTKRLEVISYSRLTFHCPSNNGFLVKSKSMCYDPSLWPCS